MKEAMQRTLLPSFSKRGHAGGGSGRRQREWEDQLG